MTCRIFCIFAAVFKARGKRQEARGKRQEAKGNDIIYVIEQSQRDNILITPHKATAAVWGLNTKI